MGGSDGFPSLSRIRHPTEFRPGVRGHSNLHTIMAKRTQRGLRLFSAFMVACGLLALAGSVLTVLDSTPTLFHSAIVVAPLHVPHSGLQPRVDEWPLLVVKQFELGRPPEPNSVEVAGVRDTGLIRLTASSSSPDRAQALASWLGDSFEASLRQSYISRGIETDNLPRVWERPASTPVLSDRMLASVASQFLIPSLLVIGGIALFRAHE